jgi:hypothetical protein
MPQPLEHSKIIELLAVTLGEEKARATWGEAVRGVGMNVADTYQREPGFAAIDALSRAPGLVGMAARFARLRLDQLPTTSPSLSRDPGSDRHAAPAQGTTLAAAGNAVDLLPFFSPALGEDKAKETLQHHARALGLDPWLLSHDDALKLLDALSTAPGLLGVVARFAKTRFLLRPSLAR